MTIFNDFSRKNFTTSGVLGPHKERYRAWGIPQSDEKQAGFGEQRVEGCEEKERSEVRGLSYYPSKVKFCTGTGICGHGRTPGGKVRLGPPSKTVNVLRPDHPWTRGTIIH